MSKRRILTLAIIGILPILIAYVVAGFDITSTLGRVVIAPGQVIAGESRGEGESTARLVVVFLDESKAGEVRAGQRAEARVGALAASLAGRVGAVGTTDAAALAAKPSEASATSVPIIVELDDAAVPVEVGSSASVRIFVR